MFDEKEMSEQFESMVSGVPIDSTSSSKSKKKTEPTLVEIEELPPKDITALPRGKLNSLVVHPDNGEIEKHVNVSHIRKKNGTRKPRFKNRNQLQNQNHNQNQSQNKKQETSFLDPCFFGSTKTEPARKRVRP